MSKKDSCVIFGAMPVSEAMRGYYEDAEVVIAADAGYQTAHKLGITPTLLLGDYDSAPPPSAAGTLILPREKDDTDTYCAARHAIALGVKSVCILGGLGGRLDHTFANLHTILFLQKNGIDACLADENTCVRVFLPGVHEVQAKENAYASLFPAGELAGGVTLEGLYYPLDNATLTNTFPVGVSNEFTAQSAKITVKSGALYYMVCQK